MEAADEIEEVLWQRFITYNKTLGGLLNYHDLRRMLPPWKKLDPRFATLPAETYQSLCYILAQRFDDYRCTEDPDLLIRPRFSFHFNRVKILGMADADPMHTIEVYLPKFGVVCYTTKWDELTHFLVEQPDQYQGIVNPA